MNKFRKKKFFQSEKKVRLKFTNCPKKSHYPKFNEREESLTKAKGQIRISHFNSSDLETYDLTTFSESRIGNVEMWGRQATEVGNFGTAQVAQVVPKNTCLSADSSSKERWKPHLDMRSAKPARNDRDTIFETIFKKYKIRGKTQVTKRKNELKLHKWQLKRKTKLTE